MARVALADRLADHLPEKVRFIGRRDAQLVAGFRQSMHRFAVIHGDRLDGFGRGIAEAKAEEKFNGAAQQGQQKRDLNQRQVDLFSRQALISTYNFPVHSVNLEVIRDANSDRGERWGRDDALELSRDAAIGISEYAPGSEIVAGGRICVSAGIARYPKKFMPDRYFRACDGCHHVQVADHGSELVQSCLNCGSAYKLPTHTCVEPIGSVTSYAEREGRDPGVSRLRSRPADETRLITIPSLERFTVGDVPSIHLHSTPRVYGAAPEGRLVVISSSTGARRGSASSAALGASTRSPRGPCSARRRSERTAILEPGRHARPRMRRGQCRLRTGKERWQLRTLQLAPDRHLAGGIDAMDLEHALGDIETDRGNLHEGWLLFL